MRGATHFRPRLWPTLAAVAGVLASVMLGNWQLHRAFEKAQLQARTDQAAERTSIHLGASPVALADVEYFPVEAQGAFKAEGTVYVDNRVHAGVPGYEIITPLRIGDSARYVLVKRGWTKAEADRSRLPAVATPPGAVTV